MTISFADSIPGVGGSKDDDSGETKEEQMEQERLRQEAIKQAERERRDKYKKQEEEREGIRQNIRDKVRSKDNFATSLFTFLCCELVLLCFAAVAAAVHLAAAAVFVCVCSYCCFSSCMYYFNNWNKQKHCAFYAAILTVTAAKRKKYFPHSYLIWEDTQQH